jgi:preprotein translocase subunit SecE
MNAILFLPQYKMNTKADVSPATDKLDPLKWLFAILLVGGGLFSFYYFEEVSHLLRIVALLASVGIAVFVASKTETGRYTLDFIRESHLEIRKVVWPTREETLQMTGVVILMVVILSILIWVIDSILIWLVRLITNH